MLEGNVAIITGGGRGIGKATAIRLASEGCDVVVCSRTAGELESVVKEINSAHNGRAIGMVCDVRNSGDVKAVVDKTIAKLGRIDILVNNAGIVVQKPVMETTEKEWDDVIDTNLKGPFLFAKEALTFMIRQRRGTIVDVSSGAGKYGFPDLAAYCASKFGLIGFGESVAREADKYGVKVFSVCPGRVATGMQERMLGKAKFKLLRHTMIQPEKIAGKIFGLVTKPSIKSGDCLEVYE